MISALGHSLQQIDNIKREMKFPLTENRRTTTPAVSDLFDKELDALAVRVLRLKYEIEMMSGRSNANFELMSLSGANKDILVMCLGMYELDLNQEIGASVDRPTRSEKQSRAMAELRLLRDTKRTLDS